MKILSLSLLITFSAFSQDFTFDKKTGKSIPNYVGELRMKKGKVSFLREGEIKETQAGSRFLKGDIIVTDERSYAKILVVDDTIISVGPKSELNFEKFKFESKTNRQIVYNLIKGQLSGLVRKKADDGDVIVKTKFTTMGIRGTKFLVNHQTLNNNLEVSEFALLTGSAEIIDEKNQKRPLKKSDRFITIHDLKKQMGAYENYPLTNEETEALAAKELDEEKEVKPLLPYFELTQIKENSILYGLLSGQSVSGNRAGTEETLERETKKSNRNWQENLKILNEKLKENQKKDP